MEPLIRAAHNGDNGNDLRCSQLKVTTFNVFIGPPLGRIDGPRFQKIASLLREEGSDVYCLQEVFSEHIVQILQDELGGDYAFCRGNDERCRTACCAVLKCILLLASVALSASVLDILVASHASTTVQYSLTVIVLGVSIQLVRAAMHTVLWSFFFKGPPGGLLTICRKDSVRAVANTFHSYTEQRGDFLNVVRNRGFLDTTLLVHGKRTTVVNMHTNAFPSINVQNAYPLASVERQRQIKQAFVHGCTIAEDHALVVVGDLNSTPELNELPVEELGLNNAWRKEEPCITLPLTDALRQVFPDTKQSMCVDYQLSKRLAVVDKKIVQSGQISDHLPVQVTYEYK
eukprot:TRINITY_DN33614_c0_g1_i1.p1 TRINITY_DN33614_c0_g1~~TRINITY_DN33614_c0_g1_i1.p1  ORF type:complete len:344 (+),score=40.94 TRINITY_DN33614_c0_g1_i1:54-1085(+)